MLHELFTKWQKRGLLLTSIGIKILIEISSDTFKNNWQINDVTIYIKMLRKPKKNSQLKGSIL